MIDPETGREVLSSRPSKLGIALRRSGIWVFLVALAVGVLTYAISSVQPKVYSTAGQIFVTEGTNANAQDVQTVAQLVGSDVVMSGVARQFDEPLGTVESELAVVPVSGANIVDVTVNVGSPRRAVGLVTAVYDNFQLVNANLPSSQRRDTYFAPPATPAAPSQPRPRRNSGVGFVLGLLIGTGLVWLRELRRPTAADTALVVERLGVPMFADLGHATLRHRLRDSGQDRSYVALSLDLDELAPKGTRVLCLAGVRSGDLRLDLPYGLARAFAQGGWRVVLVDGDPQGRFSRQAGGDGQIGLSDLPGSPDEVASRLLPSDDAGLRVLPHGRKGFNRAQPNLSDELNRIFGNLATLADLIIVAVSDVSEGTAARVLAASCQGLILTVRGSTPVATLGVAQERLALFDARLIGFIRDEPPGIMARGRQLLHRPGTARAFTASGSVAPPVAHKPATTVLPSTRRDVDTPGSRIGGAPSA